ncbi:MAG: hypothetical protein K2I34_04265, partial [Paramuribaculum sp.]|nr:hypothetical protein [Paramuribaculum sp.]
IMKKFLLTLLGASLLCGLSPHPLSAQTTPKKKTVTFNFSATTETGVEGDPKKNVYDNGLVAAGHRIKAVIPKYGDPTDFTIDTTDPVKTLTSAPAGNKSYGWGRLDLKTSETSPTIPVDFDFSRCIPAQEMPFLYTNTLSSDLSFKKQDNNPGTAFSISLDKGKRIKSIRLGFEKFSYQNTDLSTQGLNKFLGFIKTIEGFGSETASSDYKTVPHENNKSFDYATYTATDPNGTDKPLYLQLIYNSNELRITSISVTYIEETDNLPKFTNRFYVGKKYGTPIFYRVENSDEWIEAKGSETTISGSKVYVKLGNSITEFTAPSTAKPGQPTAIINAVDYQIGTTLGIGGAFFYQRGIGAIGNIGKAELRIMPDSSDYSDNSDYSD